MRTAKRAPKAGVKTSKTAVKAQGASAKRAHLKLVSGSAAPARSRAKGAFATKYEEIFEHATDAIVIVGADLQIDSMNLAAEELTGYLRAELIDASVLSLVPELEKIPMRTRGVIPEFFNSPGTYEDIAIRTKDDLVSIVDLNVRVIENGGSHLAIALFRDVTERKRMERELITKHSELRAAFVELEKRNAEFKATQDMLVQAGKMAALGEMAAGIAHEINQPLQGIRGYAQEMQYALGDRLKGQDCEGIVTLGLREVISHTDKMAKIISHLRGFTRKSTEDFDTFDVRLPVQEALKMVDRQLAMRNVKVECDFGDDVQVYANSMQLEQVFINLTTNARDAIDSTGRGSGTIRITTRKVGDFVEIRFADDGNGMNERVKAKAFNPFFTTKEVGHGMGLGLSLSYGMISKIHGSIRIESEVSRGTTFIIQIPKDFRELG